MSDTGIPNLGGTSSSSISSPQINRYHQSSTTNTPSFTSSSTLSNSLPPLPIPPLFSTPSAYPPESSRRSIRRPPSRVIRTFEEVHVTKTVNEEEWYEELECGVCAHVLGAPQTLVPCGHSLCGPCAWEWIKKNNNLTCPHCRHQLHQAMPFVPNIVVDQIIERKLRSLPETPEKVDIMVERREKAEAWKMVQEPIKPPLPKRRNFDNAVFSLFGAENAINHESQHQRRASRHIQALGTPIPEPPVNAPPPLLRRPTHPYGSGMNLAEIRRHEIEEGHVPSRAEIRRLREATLREQRQAQPPPSPVLEILHEEPVPAAVRPEVNDRPVPILRTSSSQPTSTQLPPLPRSRSDIISPFGPRPPHSRAPASRSRILEDRQARGRGSEQGG